MMTAVTKGLNSTGGGILTSPFFPARYPRDLGLEYLITCPSEAPSCRVRLLFSDFQLATVSIMEVRRLLSTYRSCSILAFFIFHVSIVLRLERSATRR